MLSVASSYYLYKGAITVELLNFNLAFCHRVDCFRPRLPRANDSACAPRPFEHLYYHSDLTADYSDSARGHGYGRQ